MVTVDDTQPIRRAPVVYGKRSSNTLPPVDERVQSFELAPHSSSPLSQPPRALNALDTEHSPSLDVDSPFQFGFRHRLKELDKQFEDHGTQSYRGSSSNNKDADLLESKRLQNVPIGTTILSVEMPRSSGDLSRPPSPPLSSLPSTQELPSDSSPVYHTRSIQNATLSDSEREETTSSSPISPVRHAITTPHSRSSPTPPTSGETVMVSRKAKGKAPARDVLPLFFDGERPSAAGIPSKSKKGRSEFLVRPRTKAPTRKERREAAFESSRIAASRPVEVMRTEERKHTLSAFFSALRRDNTTIPASGTELPSDPIERFSSPTNGSTGTEPEKNFFGAPTGLLRNCVDTGTIDRPSSFKKSKALPPAASESDDEVEMPSLASIIQRDEKEQRLRALKQVALQHADTKNTVGDYSEDDDLLVVKDDMHSVARQEAVQRRLDKAHGSPVKDCTSLRKLNHPSVHSTVISSHKLSKQELQEFAKPSFARTGKRAKTQLHKNQLDQLMMMKHTEDSLKSIKRQEEEWVKRGGRLSRDTGGDDTQNSLSQKVAAYAVQGLQAVEDVDATEELVSTDESDEDYTPNLQGSASPEPMDEGDMQAENMEDLPVSQSLGGDDDDDDDDECIALRHKYGHRHPRAVVDSDDEEIQLAQRNLSIAQKDTTSSMESQTEDENDKENSAKLMYDRSEDKENKAIARHGQSPPELSFSTRLASLHGVEDGAERSFSFVSAMNFDQTVDSAGEDIRSPLKDISKDENDFFSSPLSKSLFTDRLLRSTPRSPPQTSASAPSLGLSPALRSKRINRAERPPLNSRIDEEDTPRFLGSLQSRTSPEPSPPCLNLTDSGFSQLFADEDQSLKKSVDEGQDRLALTLDVGLKPALEIGGTLQRRAEAIFEKEQEYVVAAVAQQNARPKELLYVNDHGFLTQTRPEDSSPQIYRMTPTQTTKLVGAQGQSPQTRSPSMRPPLRTLSFTTSRETSPQPQPLKRLHRGGVSPLEQKKGREPATKLNAFAILGKAPKPLSRGQDENHEKSEFVAVEAEESDEDDMFGFGGRKGDDEEEGDNEQDKIIEGLVDDTVMDAETEAADLVQEKFREHEEEDDQRLQKLHEDATKGKFRIKRRGREVGLEDDSEEDEDEDEDEHRIRQRIHKKRKIQGDSLEALGQNEETRAFYDSYHQDLIDEDNEFEYLQGNLSIAPEDEDAQAEEPQEIVSTDEIRRRVREVVDNNYDIKMVDSEDIDWVDRAMDIEADDAVPVKMAGRRQSKAVDRHANAGHVDFDEERSTRRAASEQELQQLSSWAKDQGHGHQGTGRSGNATAVTGHTVRAKSGGGSLRSTQPSKPSAVSAMRKTKTASMLSIVSSRSDKFS